MIEREHRGPVALLTMGHGKANTLDLVFMRALTDALREEAESDAGAVVLTGNGKIFSGGVDLFQMVEGGADYVAEMVPALSELLYTAFTLPKPFVTAISGHAIAAGCVLALTSDYRIMSEEAGRIGVPELDFGVPFPTTLTEVLRYVVPREHQHEIIFRGGTYPSDQALEMGMVDELIPSHSLIHRAVEEAMHMARVPSPIFQVTKAQVRNSVVTSIEKGREMYDQTVLDILSADSTMNAIRDYMDRTFGRQG